MRLMAEVRKSSVDRLARELGVAVSYLYKQMAGTRGLSREVLDRLGLDEVVMYQERRERGDRRERRR